MSAINNNPPNNIGSSPLFSNAGSVPLNQQPHSQSQMGSGFPSQYQFSHRTLSKAELRSLFLAPAQPAYVQFTPQLKHQNLSHVQQQSGLGTPFVNTPGRPSLKLPTQDDNTNSPLSHSSELYETAVRKKKHKLLLDKQRQERFSKKVSINASVEVKSPTTIPPIAGTKRTVVDPQGNEANMGATEGDKTLDIELKEEEGAEMMEASAGLRTSHFEKPSDHQDSGKNDERIAMERATEAMQVPPKIGLNTSSQAASDSRAEYEISDQDHPSVELNHSSSSPLATGSSLKRPTQGDNTNSALRCREVNETYVRKKKHKLLLDKQHQEKNSKEVSTNDVAKVKPPSTIPITGTKRIVVDPLGNEANSGATQGDKTLDFEVKEEDVEIMEASAGLKSSHFEQPSDHQDSVQNDEHIAVERTSEAMRGPPKVGLDSSIQPDLNEISELDYPSVELNHSSTPGFGQQEALTANGEETPVVNPSMGLSDDEVIAKAKLTREAILSQAKATHQWSKELLFSGFVHFLRSLFSLSKDTSDAEVKELVDMANDCASWGFNTEGALQRIRIFQKKREIAKAYYDATRQALEERRKKIEADTAKMMDAVAKLQAEHERIKADEAGISLNVISSPEFDGAFEGFGLSC